MMLILSVWQSRAAEIWVSPTGSDQNSGTKEQPMATPSAALRKVRELRRLNDASVKDGIHIIVKGGTYQLFEPVFVRPEDSGTATSPTTIEAAPNEVPVLSGGEQIKGWQKVKGSIPGLPQVAKGNVWVADALMAAGNMLNFRQLWVNERKAIRAKSINADGMSRILSWNHKEQTCWIPKPKTGDLTAVAGMEMFIHQWWAIAVLRIKSIQVRGDSAKLSFMQPESRVQSEHPWPAPFISKKPGGNSAFYLINAIQFLDEPGEWYLDAKTRKVYYWPRKGENMTTVNIVAPSLETLVKVEGSIDNPVSYVYFKGISFKYATWLYPSKAGLVPHQAGMYMLDAYKLKVPGTPDKKGLENQAWVGRPAAAVEVSYANHTGFEACRFEHMASTGLDYKRGTHDDEVKGCLFKDIGGTGILAGVFSDEATEVHLPYNPKDAREVCTNEHISNNVITDISNEDWGCVGIGAGYVKGISIEHNEICETSYSGISVGWGWTKTTNAMSDNRIHANKVSHYAKHMYDVAGVYTLSAQAGTIISENYVDSIYKASYAHDPVHWFYLYLDEGSSNITVKDNWTPAEKYLKNANGPGNVWENNGPKVSDQIKNAAGLEPAYQYLLKEKVINPAKQQINIFKL
ncbi:MAG: right-handed parallel beta-helix repeat-containing protein [Mucilaginibacter sp.]|uniref:right-handed parallel beta-helix repeat-containing protein n=1 Tax=Mucilaginibacter sp. TaxID=1882438 RepID=UPI003265A337